MNSLFCWKNKAHHYLIFALGILSIQNFKANGVEEQLNPLANIMLRLAFRCYPDQINKINVPDGFKDITKDKFSEGLLLQCKAGDCFPTLYYNQEKGLGILCFRGTCSDIDVLYDFKMSQGLTANLVVAHLVAERAAETIPKLLLTGHSKGAMEASYAGARIHRRALVFCSVGFTDFSKISGNPLELLVFIRDKADFIKYMKPSPYYQNDYDVNSLNVYIEGDALVGVGKTAGLNNTISSIQMKVDFGPNGKDKHTQMPLIEKAMTMLSAMDIRKINTFLGNITPKSTTDANEEAINITTKANTTDIEGVWKYHTGNILIINGNNITLILDTGVEHLKGEITYYNGKKLKILWKFGSAWDLFKGFTNANLDQPFLDEVDITVNDRKDILTISTTIGNQSVILRKRD